MQINSKYKDIAVDYSKRLNDVRFVGQAIFVVLVLLISWSGVKSIQANYGLQKQITTLNHQNTLQKLQNQNLALQNDYYHSKQYLELSARQNFGLAANGEKLIIVPANIALSHTIETPDLSKQATAKAKQSGYQSNFQAWLDFFLHRQGS